VKLAFTPQAWEDYLYWQETEPQISKRIRQLIKDTLRDPHRGIGKPEPLKHALQGCWARRISDEHRMVYQVCKSELLIMQLRYHYE
jgi:toxin YoeB